jgi:SOS-response transcriptional repressor LexA
MTFPATQRQGDVLRFIAGYQEAHGGVSPSFEEIAAALGLKGKSCAHWMLDALEERGHVRRLRNRARAIEVLRPVSIPRGPAGEPLFMVRL